MVFTEQDIKFINNYHKQLQREIIQLKDNIRQVSNIAGNEHKRFLIQLENKLTELNMLFDFFSKLKENLEHV